MTDNSASHEAVVSKLLPERPRLLVVDDQPVNVQALYQAFQEDHEVIMATSGERALEICKTSCPDLILLDVMMPEMDGLELCRRLKAQAQTAAVPVLFVTAQESPEDETRGLEVGAVDFITKPINPSVVRARVKTHLTLKAQADYLRSLAFIDGLTGVANRRQFDERLPQEWRACMRSGVPLAIIMIDVDQFKLYNDHYGHAEGDECLRAVGAVLRATATRGRDLVARYGGEEFVVLVPEATLQQASNIAEECRLAIEQLQLPHARSEVAKVVTASLGVAAQLPTSGGGTADLLAQADANLYAAKWGGRNRVVSSEASAEQPDS